MDELYETARDIARPTEMAGRAYAIDSERPMDARPEPELHRALGWLIEEADRLQALVAQAEDALASILPASPEADRGVPAADFRTALGQGMGGAAARLSLSNARLAELIERVRVAL